jgi:hypothetical protein
MHALFKRQVECKVTPVAGLFSWRVAEFESILNRPAVMLFGLPRRQRQPKSLSQLHILHPAARTRTVSAAAFRPHHQNFPRQHRRISIPTSSSGVTIPNSSRHTAWPEVRQWAEAEPALTARGEQPEHAHPHQDSLQRLEQKREHMGKHERPYNLRRHTDGSKSLSPMLMSPVGPPPHRLKLVDLIWRDRRRGSRMPWAGMLAF